MRGRPRALSWRHRWWLGFAAASTGLALVRLLALGSSPPGLHQDEASIGYDAWAIAHHGVDQHGLRLPLFFQSFDDYKSPIYHYLLAPLTWVLPLTNWAVRLPAAGCGLVICALAALTAHRLTGSRAVALLTLLTAGLMPWLFVESRLGFEVITLVLALQATLWCLAHAWGGRPEQHPGQRRAWFAAAGLGLAAGELAYPTGRLLVALLMAALVAVRASAARGPGRERWAGWWLALVAPLAGYTGLGLWAAGHPGTLTARFQGISIINDDPALPTAVARLAGNYLSYWSPWFLGLRGDTNLRHGSGVGGLLLLATFPALLAGLISCWRRRAEPLPRLVLLGLAVAPVPAALTREGTPHSLRAAVMIPLLLLVMSWGWRSLLPWLARSSAWRTGLVLLATLQVAIYLGDLYVTYPARAEGAFDVGIPEAILLARQLAGAHPVLLSDGLGQPYAHALFALRPPPGADLDSTLAAIGVEQLGAGEIRTLAQPGDLVVLAPGETPPRRARLLSTSRHRTAWGGSAPAALVYRV